MEALAVILILAVLVALVVLPAHRTVVIRPTVAVAVVVILSQAVGGRVEPVVRVLKTP